MYTKRHLLLSLLLLTGILILFTTSSLLISSLSSHSSRTRTRTPYRSSSFLSSKNTNSKKSKYNPSAWFPSFLQSKPSAEWYPSQATFDTAVRETNLPLPLHDRVPGFALFDRLYMRNGTMYVVTRDKNKENVGNPVGEKLQIITPKDAKQILGDYVIPINGMTFIFHDDQKFMKDYYNWWAHLVLGAMRVYSSLSLVKGEKTPLAEPARFLLPTTPAISWRDPSHLNAPLMRAAFPSSPIEGSDAWSDLAMTGRTYVWERVMLVSTGVSTSRNGKETLNDATSTPLPVHLSTIPSLPFWSPIRHRTTHNTLGYLPVLNPHGRLYLNSLPPDIWDGVADERRRNGDGGVIGGVIGGVGLGDGSGSGDERRAGDGVAGYPNSNPINDNAQIADDPTIPTAQPTLLPLITLLNTQGAQTPGERLHRTAYADLKGELRRLEWVGLVRFREVEVGGDGEFINGDGKMGVEMGVIAESAILIGVHGPGLIHQLWMPSTARSSIIELFHPGVYVSRYEALAKNVGHQHYAMWNTALVSNTQGDSTGTAILDLGLDTSLTKREDSGKANAKPKPNFRLGPIAHNDDADIANSVGAETHVNLIGADPSNLLAPDTEEPPHIFSEEDEEEQAVAPSDADTPAPVLVPDDAEEPDSNQTIPVSGAAIARLVKDILTRKLNEDEEDVVYV